MNETKEIGFVNKLFGEYLPKELIKDLENCLCDDCKININRMMVNRWMRDNIETKI